MTSTISAFRGGFLLLTGLAAFGVLTPAGAAGPTRSVIPAIVAQSKVGARVAPDTPVDLAISLPLRNEDDLDLLIKRLYDPKDAYYGAYLTPDEFAAKYGPSESDYDAVAAYVQAQGLTVTQTHPNRLLLDITGPAAAVEATFGVHLRQYTSLEGRVFWAPETEPLLPAAIAGRISGIAGLSDSAIMKPHYIDVTPSETASIVNSAQVGTGQGGGLTPSDLRVVYGLSGTGLSGTGQTVAIFELDGYNTSDINTYANTFSLPDPPLENVLVDGASGTAGTNSEEVVLDIEMVLAMAPGAAKVLVYEGPNTGPGVLDTYNRIATDGRAKQMSTSWGQAEAVSTPSFMAQEQPIFKQMAAQGQGAFAVAGDDGAYDNGSTLSVDDPGSQPYVTCVGGTRVTPQFAGGPWQSETTWNQGSASAGAGGGGISTQWPIPSYQVGAAGSGSGASTTKRNVPDVSLNASTQSAYAIYQGGRWRLAGGTSASAPLWAGFSALVNQQRIARGNTSLGFANPAIYTVGKGSRYDNDFHDIADGSTNLAYTAVPGYDLATGWGSFIGAGLIADLAPPPSISYPAGLNFISLPNGYAGKSLSSIFGYSGVKLAVYDAVNKKYVTTPTAPANQISLGQGYWVRFPSSVTVALNGTAASTAGNFTIVLPAGWNQIGNPFPSSVNVSSLQVKVGSSTTSFSTAANSTIGSVLYRYSAGSGYVPIKSTGSLAPGQAYWVCAIKALTLSIPPP